MTFAADNAQDAWHWVAHYTDNGTIGEYELDDDGNEVAHSWQHIDMSKFHYLELIPQRPWLGRHILALPDGARPIFFRRRLALQELDSQQVVDSGIRPITCIGWQKTVEGKNVASFTFLLEDGTSVLSDDRDAVYFGEENVPNVKLPTTQ